MLYKYLSRNGTALAFMVSVVVIIITMIPIIMGLEAFESIDVKKQSFSEEGDIFMLGIYLSVVLLIVAIIAALVLSLVNVVSDPKAAMKSIISIGLILVAFGILYSISDAQETGSLAETIKKFEISDGISKIISAGISTTLLLSLGTVAIVVLMEIWNFFKS